MKTVKINVDIENKSVDIASNSVLSLTQQMRLLKKELQTVPQDSEQFQILATKFRDTEDALKQVNVRSRDFFSALGTMPGVIGVAGRSMDGLIDTFTIFGAIKLDDLKAQMKDSWDGLKNIATTMGKVTGITKVYTTLNTALAGSFTKVGMSAKAAATSAKIFSAALVTTGVGAMIAAVSLLIGYITKLAGAQDRANTSMSALNTALLEQSQLIYETAYNKAKAAGASEEELYQMSKTYLIKKGKDIQDAADKEIAITKNKVGWFGTVVEAMKNPVKFVVDLAVLNEAAVATEKYTKKIEGQNEVIKAGSELADLENDKIAKGTEARKKASEQRAEDIKTIGEAQKAAKYVLLSDQEAEIAKTREKYDTLISLASKYKQDTAGLIAAMNKDIDEINQKYTDKTKEDQKKQAEGKMAVEISALELKKANGTLKEEEYQLALRDIRIKYATEEKEFNDIDAEYAAFQKQSQYDNEKNALTQKYLDELSLKAMSDEEKIFAEEAYKQGLLDLDIKYAESEAEVTDLRLEDQQRLISKLQEVKDVTKEVNKQMIQSWIDLGSSVAGTFSTLANVFEEGSGVAKTFAIISVVVNAAAAFGRISAGLAESMISLGTAHAQGLATLASGTALMSNPITMALGIPMVAGGTSAIAMATAGMAAVKANAVIQKIGVGTSSAVQIAAILGAKKTSSASSAAGGGTGASIPLPTFSQTTKAAAPTVSNSMANPQGELANTVTGAINANNSQTRPIQTYVVGDQVTTQQQLDRRISTAARMGG